MILQSIPQLADVDHCVRQWMRICSRMVQQHRQVGEWVGELYASRI
jgi:hypothetical protein